MGEQSYQAENGAERARLRDLIARLSDDDLRRPVGHGWTVAAALAHLAFWDRRNLAALEDWERNGVHVSSADADVINDGMLPQWLAMPPRDAANEALAAAEAVDRKVETLSAELVEEIQAKRPRSLIRALHRREHLEEIEQVLATRGAASIGD